MPGFHNAARHYFTGPIRPDFTATALPLPWEGDDVTMCTWFSDKLDAAMAQGIAQGVEKERTKIKAKLRANGMSDQEIDVLFS